MVVALPADTTPIHPQGASDSVPNSNPELLSTPSLSSTCSRDIFSLLVGSPQLWIVSTSFHQNTYGHVDIILHQRCSSQESLSQESKTNHSNPPYFYPQAPTIMTKNLPTIPVIPI